MCNFLFRDLGRAGVGKGRSRLLKEGSGRRNAHPVPQTLQHRGQLSGGLDFPPGEICWEDSQGVGWSWGLGKALCHRRLLQRGGGHPQGWAGLCCHLEPLLPHSQGVSDWRARRAGGSTAAAAAAHGWAGPAAATAPSPLRLQPPNQPCLSAEPLSAASRPPRLKSPCPAGERAS